MQLRFRGPDCASQDLPDLLMLIARDIVEKKNRAITWRQLPDGFLQRNMVHQRHPEASASDLDLNRSGTVFCHLLHPHDRSSKVHEYFVHCQTMQPGSKRGVAAKGLELAKELNEYILR